LYAIDSEQAQTTWIISIIQ